MKETQYPILELPEDGLIDDVEKYKQVLGGTYCKNELHFDNELLKGKIFSTSISDEVSVSFYETEFKETAILRRSENENRDAIRINFLLELESNRDININGASYNSGIGLILGKQKETYIIPQGKANWMVFQFTQKILKEAYPSEAAELLQSYFNEQELVLFFEQLRAPLKKRVLQIQQLLSERPYLFFYEVKGIALDLFVKAGKLFYERVLIEKGIQLVDSETMEALFKVKSILEQSVDNPPTIEALSKESGMNIRKLQRLFKQVFGLTVFGYLNVYRQEEALRLLQNSTFNFSEIADQLGYSSLSHFSSSFKKYHGVPPKDFKMLIQDFR
ncbi:helix-turn-helix transcriptional regulator [Sediminitomix flava]|uniref:AraC-like DNA-binding protein n=1 Tax=Sediminitomix flava TaxID=379075 RepID=A0A315ZG38_SEDFL|nr:AraC family transcriptional regulator [Sediminitomix flava]PWJ44555.1 AraC-like DNA-binding protein [Sediminitomix flava]